MRVLIEVLHLAAGLAAAMLIAALATWSYASAKSDIWLVTYVAMAAVVLMGIGPLRRAYREDRRTVGSNGGGGDDDKADTNG